MTSWRVGKPLTSTRSVSCVSWRSGPAVVEPFDPLGRKTPSQVLDERVQMLAPSTPLAESLNRAGIEVQEFTRAYRTITGSPIYQEALNASTDDLGEFRFALARAIVAQVMAQCGSFDDSAPILCEADLRDDLVDQLANEWGGQPKGLVATG